MRRFIKAGWGVYVGQNFARLNAETEIEVTDWYGGAASVFGTIAGNPSHALGFMRSTLVNVRVDARAIIERE